MATWAPPTSPVAADGDRSGSAAAGLLRDAPQLRSLLAPGGAVRHFGSTGLTPRAVALAASDSCGAGIPVAAARRQRRRGPYVAVRRARVLSGQPARHGKQPVPCIPRDHNP